LHNTVEDISDNEAYTLQNHLVEGLKLKHHQVEPNLENISDEDSKNGLQTIHVPPLEGEDYATTTTGIVDGSKSTAEYSSLV
jgi:hypothetical protein